MNLIVDKKNRIWIPPILETPIMLETHEKLLHPGSSKLYPTLSRYIHIKNMKEKISNLIRSCIKCQCSKRLIRKQEKLFGYLKANSPFEFVCTDIRGPVTIENDLISEKWFVVSFVDIFSRYTALELVERITGEVICETFERRWINFFPLTKKFLSDNGRQYTSIVLKNFLEKSGIQHVFTTPYNPTANSIAERLNQDIDKGFSILKGSQARGIVQRIELGLNESVNRTTGYSPTELISQNSYSI